MILTVTFVLVVVRNHARTLTYTISVCRHASPAYRELPVSADDAIV